MCWKILEYNQYTKEVFAYQQQLQEKQYPFLKLSVDELLSLHFTEEELERYQFVLKCQEERLNEEHSLLSVNALYALASAVIDIWEVNPKPFTHSLLLQTLAHIPSSVMDLVTNRLYSVSVDSETASFHSTHYSVNFPSPAYHSSYVINRDC